MQFDPGNGSHGSLYGLGVVNVGCSVRTEYMLDTKPVGNADNRSQVSGILYVVQCQTEASACYIRVKVIMRLLKNRQYFLWRFQQTCP